jgi:2-polyprenyl-6-methoxyphenol hydroxylase-like FAD-dependent oxidoreductase
MGRSRLIIEGRSRTDRFENSITVDVALDAFSPRRRPRVDWIQEQSDALGRNVLAPAAIRDAVIKERGAQAFRERYTPLLPAP